MDLFPAFELLRNADEQLARLAGDMGGWYYLAVSFSIFAETGLVVAPFFPGETLIFGTAALVAAEGARVNLWILSVCALVSTVTGDLVNYVVARKVGRRIFRRKKGRIFTERQVEQARDFFERFGGKTLIFCRFLPVIRSAAPFMAGVGGMSLRRVVLFVSMGSIGWVAVFTLAGYFFGRIDYVQRHFQLVVTAVVAIGLVPTAVGFVRSRRF